jgi:hypothetical protein
MNLYGLHAKMIGRQGGAIDHPILSDEVHQKHHRRLLVSGAFFLAFRAEDRERVENSDVLVLLFQLFLKCANEAAVCEHLAPFDRGWLAVGGDRPTRPEPLLEAKTQWALNGRATGKMREG